MINTLTLHGRITEDLELKTSNNGKYKVWFKLAVHRNCRNKDGEYEGDFPNVVAYGSTANYIVKHVKKGSRVLVKGRTQTSIYSDENGVTKFFQYVYAEEVNVIDYKTDKENVIVDLNEVNNDFEEIDDDDLPF